MLKVVGASWLQTRIASYILVAVIIMGIGAIVFGEFCRIENDGTYAATVTWSPKTGYKIDYWKQGNDLGKIPRRAARAYYRTRMQETGWSFVEIETSPDYPDTVQAFAAGFLEGALTWQLVYQHWRNTIEAPCQQRAEVCGKIRKGLKENVEATWERAHLLAADDPFWHMVRLFYTQLDGLEKGWRQAVKRSKNSAEISHEDFLWLALASDISNFGPEDKPTSERNFNVEAGGILVKSVEKADVDELIGIIHSTAAPYQKMLRLLKKYTFGYHVNPAKNSDRVPTRSIVASSYPGALSSQDEYYIVYGENPEDTMILAGTPLAPTKSGISEAEGEIIFSDKQESHTVMSSARIMSSNWLASSALSWGRLLARRQAPEDLSRPVQWILTAPGPAIWIIEQHPTETHAADFTRYFAATKSLFCNGHSVFTRRTSSPELPGSFKISAKTDITTPQISKKTDQTPDELFEITTVKPDEIFQKTDLKSNQISENTNEESPEFPQEIDQKMGNELTEIFPKTETNSDEIPQTTDEIPNKIANKFTKISPKTNQNSPTELPTKNPNSALNSRLIGETPGAEDIMGFRGDLGKKAVPFGNIDTKLVLMAATGIESFQVTSGPFSGRFSRDFEWARDFPTVPHTGQPERFNFDPVSPLWAWI